MSEALLVFDSIANSRWFAKSTLILFMNKIDLFQAKLPSCPLSAAFPNYKGDDNDYAQASEFLLLQFKQLYRNKSRSLYHHFTNATDTKMIEVVMAAVQDQIVNEMLQMTGLLM